MSAMTAPSLWQDSRPRIAQRRLPTTDQDPGTPGAAPAGADSSQSGLRPQMAMLFRALLASPVRNALFTL